MSRFIPPYADVGKGITPSDGAKYYFFESGTSNPKNTYSDESLTTPNTNPVISDGNGVFPDIWLESGKYKVRLTDKKDVQSRPDADPVEGLLFDNVVQKSGTDVVFDVDTVNDAVISAGLVEGQALNIKERTVGNRGGAMWDVVLASSVTPNTFDIVQCTGVPTLAIVLRVEGVANVRQFGATGDGSTDDAAAIQSAVDYVIAQGFGAVYIPSGQYKIGAAISIVGTGADLRIYGDHYRASELKANSANINNLNISASVTGIQVTVENLRMSGFSLGGGTGRGIEIKDCQSVTLRQVWMSTMPTYGLWVENCSDIVTDRVTTEFTVGGVRLTTVTFSEIDVQVYFSSGASVSASDVKRTKINVISVDSNTEGVKMDVGVNEDNSVSGIVRNAGSASGMQIKGSRIRVSATVLGSNKNGIFVYDSEDVVIGDSNVSNSNQAASSFSGIAFTNCKSCAVGNVTASDNQGSPTQLNGVHVNGSANQDISLFGVVGQGNTGNLISDTGTRTDIGGVVRSTTANLSSVLDLVNTYNKYPGKEVFNVTDNRKLYSNGSGASSSWKYMDGSVAINPV